MGGTVVTHHPLLLPRDVGEDPRHPRASPPTDHALVPDVVLPPTRRQLHREEVLEKRRKRRKREKEDDQLSIELGIELGIELVGIALPGLCSRHSGHGAAEAGQAI